MEVFRSIHKPLQGPQDFRLLDLLPGTGEEQIRCELSLANLALRPEYYALSYTWGSKDSPVLIYVDDTAHWIQNNLHGFFLQLRLRNSRRTIWVDSICINQKDNVEKATSIPLMREIYTAAQSVLVWLGPHLDGSAELFHYLYMRLAAGSSEREDVRMSRLDSLEEPHGYIDSTDSIYEPLVKLLHRPYWKRTWIIQEVVLAKNIRIFCGDSSIPWADFVSMVQQLHKAPSASSPPSPFESICELRKFGANFTFRQATLMEYYDGYEDSDRDGPMAHYSECEDKRDLVYGVLGLIRDSGHHLQIDYSCTMEAFVCSLLLCFESSRVSLLGYYIKLMARLGVESAQCLTYAKQVLGGRLAGDVSSFLARRNLWAFSHTQSIITHVDGETIHIAGETTHLANHDSFHKLRLTSTWEAENCYYRQYRVEEDFLGKETDEDATCIWTDIQVRPADFFFRRGYQAFSDGGKQWRLILFGRDLQTAKGDFTLLGYGVETMREAAATADFKQRGGGMATFFNDGQPDFGTHNLGLGLWTWAHSTSIFEILLLAAFDKVFEAAHGEYDFPSLSKLDLI
jgi:hypothetical protein